MAQAGDITALLQQADEGKPEAQQRLYALVEPELRRIARKRKQAVLQAADDVSTTFLVDEAFLQLVGKQATLWNPGDRRKFFGYVARKMHDLLIQAARRHEAAKRGGKLRRHDQDQLENIADAGGDPKAQQGVLFDLREALEKFERFALDDAILFRLRYFLGCTFAEMAEIWSISETAAKEAWQRGRAWLQRALKEYHHDA